MLTPQEYQQVYDHNSNMDRVDGLVEFLLTKMDRQFDTFCAILRLHEYHHLADALSSDAGGYILCIS